jgi:hypothetical protein
MQAFLDKYKIKLVVKNKSNFMKAAGLLQTLLSKISYKEFMNGYASTIGNTIYGKADWIDRIKNGTANCDDVALLVHETMHTSQFRDGSYLKYVRSGGRALLEAEAIAAANIFRRAVGDDRLKTRADIIAQLVQYGCKFSDASAAATYVEMAQMKPTSKCKVAADAAKEFLDANP